MLNQEKRLALFYSAMGATSLLLFASFHPLDFNALAWVALVPMLIATTSFTKYRHVFAFGTATGFLFHMIGLGWLALCSPESWVVTVILEGLYMGLSVVLATLAHRRLALPYGFVLPVIWTALDFERSRYKFFAFPWMLISQSQHSHDTLIQIADITGVYGPGFFVLMCNGLLLDTILLKTTWRNFFLAPNAVPPKYRASFKRVKQGWGVLLGLIIISLIYGAVRLSQVRSEMKDSANILCIQTDFPSRNDGIPLSSYFVTSRTLDQTELGIQKHIGEYDVVVWPETTWYYTINKTYLEFIDRQRMMLAASGEKPEKRLIMEREINQTRRLLSLPKVLRSDLIVGAVHYEIEDQKLVAKHNSAFWLAHEPGNVSDFSEIDKRVKGRFDKLNPVPVSEYIPGKDTLLFDWFFRALRKMVPPGFVVFDRGEKPQIFDVKGHKLAPNICFDVSFGHSMREATLAGADVHVNMSNYSWFRSSQALDFVKIQGKFRAIETRRGVVKVINGGPSCSFDPDGQISEGGKGILPHLSKEDLEEEARRAEQSGKSPRMNNQGVLLARSKTTNFKSFYVRFGDVFAWILVLATFVLMGLAWKKPCLEADAGAEAQDKTT
ncbi:MAG: apolipoprotein N-acyltransferase [Planctomycetota bacterium]|nr:apolipoprotein N-acyltransferase [Planctomycetota bacterium]